MASKSGSDKHFRSHMTIAQANNRRRCSLKRIVLAEQWKLCGDLRAWLIQNPTHLKIAVTASGQLGLAGVSSFTSHSFVSLCL